MSKAEELLNTLESNNASLMALNGEEPHIVIGADRYITVPDQLKRIAVQYDHNIETVTFDCPRYWDDHDMSKMAIYINYLCPNRISGVFSATNVKVSTSDSSIMQFDWTISSNVTMADGKLTFLVCVKNTDSDGNEKNHWNSELCTDCYISKGLEINAEAYEDIVPDFIAQWHKEVLDATTTLYQQRDDGVFDGATFTPMVNSVTGVITWTNNKGKPNPTPVNIKGPAGVSPTLQVTDIQGGHRITITDANGSKSFDVMDTIINSTDAVNELMNRFVTIGNTQPSVGPALWFDSTGHNAIYHAELKFVDSNNSVTPLYPDSVEVGYRVSSDDGVVYSATIPGIEQLSDGTSFIIIPTTTSTETHPILNINNFGDYEIVRRSYSTTSSLETSPAQDDYGEWNTGWLSSDYPVRVTFSTIGSCFIADFPIEPNFVKLNSSQYGSVLPYAGNVGRLYFKKV